MARPAGNAARQPAGKALAKLPPAPKAMKSKEQRAIYTRYGQIMVEAGTLAATDLPMLESAARVRASLDEAYADAGTSRATVAALERLHKEQLIQLGLTPASRRSGQRLEPPRDPDEQQVRDLLG